MENLSPEAEALLASIEELFEKGVLRIDITKEYDDEDFIKNYPCIRFNYAGKHKILSKSSIPVKLN